MTSKTKIKCILENIREHSYDIAIKNIFLNKMGNAPKGKYLNSLKLNFSK